MKLATAIVSCLTLCLSAPVPVAAQSEGETAFVMALMRGMNQLSVRFDREVCGFVLRAEDGRYASTKVSWGGAASCASLPLQPGMVPVSSWHTHAAWARGYDGEVPSIQDVEGDMSMGVNGWVATPGGRLWFVDGRTGALRQVCGRGCLPVDPGFVPEEHGPVPDALSLDGLYGRFGRAR
jgi:hypothetical protein